MSGFNELRAYLRKKTQRAVHVLSVVDSHQNPRDLQGVRFVMCDLGAGGVGLESLLSFEKGDVVEIKFALPSGREVSAHCIVKNVRSEPRAGRKICQAGLEFLKISDSDRKAITDFVGSGDFMV
jgi:c-di-GMP-binding flagellar brake protein YcgR